MIFNRGLILSFFLCGMFSILYAETSLSDTVIWEPKVVGIPPSDAYIGLSLLETGEIRHYNYGEQAEAGTFIFQATTKDLHGQKLTFLIIFLLQIHVALLVANI